MLIHPVAQPLVAKQHPGSGEWPGHAPDDCQIPSCLLKAFADLIEPAVTASDREV